MAVDAGTGHRPLSWFNSRPGLQFPSPIAVVAALKRIIQLRRCKLPLLQPRRSDYFKANERSSPISSLPQVPCGHDPCRGHPPSDGAGDAAQHLCLLRLQ